MTKQALVAILGVTVGTSLTQLIPEPASTGFVAMALDLQDFSGIKKQAIQERKWRKSRQSQSYLSQHIRVRSFSIPRVLGSTAEIISMFWTACCQPYWNFRKAAISYDRTEKGREVGQGNFNPPPIFRSPQGQKYASVIHKRGW